MPKPGNIYTLRTGNTMILPTWKILSSYIVFTNVTNILTSSTDPSKSTITCTDPSRALVVSTLLEWNSWCQLYEQIILNGLGFIIDANHTRGIYDRCFISWISVTLLGIVVHWKVGKHNHTNTHSNDYKVRALYIATKMTDLPRHIKKR